MCPVCFATMGLLAVGAASTGGLAALAVKVSRKKTSAREITPESTDRSFQFRFGQVMREVCTAGRNDTAGA
jgi:hypothetical protein